MKTPMLLAARLLLAALFAIGTTATSAQTTEYVHTDALGSVVAITDANRNLVERREYEPYGYQLTPTIENGPGYTGHVQDAATGLTYMQQRYYDPLLGRFLSVDPVTAGSSGANFNRYWYGNNNPYAFADPDGRNAVTFIGGLITESWNAVNGRGFDGDMVMGALADGYNGEGDGFVSAAFQDATTLIPIGTALRGLQAAKNIARIAKTGLQANRAAGKAAELLAAKELVAEGNILLGSQVAARTANGLRYIDHLIMTPAGKIIAVEVKAGNAVRSAAQVGKDASMAADGAVLIGKNTPEHLRGLKIAIDTIVRRYR